LKAKAGLTEQGHAAENEPGFRFQRAQWERHAETLARFPKQYESADAAYEEIDRLNAEVAWIQGHKAGKTGFGPGHELPKAIEAVEAAIDELADFLGESPPPPTRTTPESPAVLAKMTPYERLEVFYNEGLLIAEAQNAPFNVTAAIFGVREMSRWSVQVAEELKKVAPQYYPEWLRSLNAGSGRKDLQTRLDALGAIMSKLLAEEQR
jgi:hypothetical protein